MRRADVVGASSIGRERMPPRPSALEDGSGRVRVRRTRAAVRRFCGRRKNDGRNMWKLCRRRRADRGQCGHAELVASRCPSVIAGTILAVCHAAIVHARHGHLQGHVGGRRRMRRRPYGEGREEDDCKDAGEPAHQVNSSPANATVSRNRMVIASPGILSRKRPRIRTMKSAKRSFRATFSRGLFATARSSATTPPASDHRSYQLTIGGHLGILDIE